ncbi:MAG: bifunctional N-acetylglucosamine-1-phosphate uridyltransferase/glucosamine-1-phosphate acetyltransferase, partial [Nitrospirales bacterium]|nr:bifunctional N-acetylglucosamine-1-phosphate uridyltransferase/glucosamine-1-phosphate acetyltransferase [Nitrospirales bacterium]
MSIAVVILAAGQGTRMRSSLPKVLHPIFGKPLLSHVVDAVRPLGPEEIIVMVGKKSEGIRSSLEGYPVRFVVQEDPKGTGDAVRIASGALEDFITRNRDGVILILNGDTPLIRPETIGRFIALHREREEAISILSFDVSHKHAYGRIIRDGEQVAAIIEDRDCTEAQKKVTEVNSGIYAMKPDVMMDLIPEIRMNEAKGEYYLTDIVGIAVRKGLRVGAHILGTEAELTGINTREELYRAGLYMRDLIVDSWMEKDVTFMNKSSVFIHPDAEIGPGTVIYPNVHIEGKTIIGRGCTIYPNTRIIDCSVGDGVVVKDSTVMESSIVREGASIGPFAHIRPGSEIGVA